MRVSEIRVNQGLGVSSILAYIRISCFYSEAERSKFRRVCGFHSRWPMGLKRYSNSFFLSNLIKPGFDMGA